MEFYFNSLYERKQLDLSSLGIQTIHYDTFNGLSNLEKLNLDYNKLRKIDFNLKDLYNLKYLSLQFNEIVQFGKNELVGLNQLELVCLYNNPLSALFPTSLSDLCSSNPKCIVNTVSKCLL